MGQLEAVNLLKRISIDKITSGRAAVARSSAGDKSALPRLSRDFTDAMFEQSERISARQAAEAT